MNVKDEFLVEIDVVVTYKQRLAAASSFASNQRRVSFDNLQELNIEVLATKGATEEQRKPKNKKAIPKNGLTY